ncbi:MAG: DUF4032 domain-containing protein [Micromonosporaceae bacterium]
MRITAVPADTELLDLPWSTPLEDWPAERLVTLPRGISRHVVRFVEIAGSRAGSRAVSTVYAVKETARRTAEREYALLRQLERIGAPAVEAVAVVYDRRAPDGTELDAALITRHLAFSLPYRALFSETLRTEPLNRLLDALALLLVRLHLTGFFWGDCSLSNTLFRRDAGAFAAYLVDAETGALHPRLSDGQRTEDIELARVNLFGEALDVQAAGLLDPAVDPEAVSEEVVTRYRSLWRELTYTEFVRADERYRLEARVRRLNDLGFDVAELALATEEEGFTLTPKVVDAGHHTRRLKQLTGLDTQENQARRLLNDLDRFRAAYGISDEQAGAQRWLTQIFEPVVRAVPPELRGKLEPPEAFHQLLDHRWYLSEQAGEDVGFTRALPSYLSTVLPGKPDEVAVLTREDESSVSDDATAPEGV